MPQPIGVSVRAWRMGAATAAIVTCVIAGASACASSRGATVRPPGSGRAGQDPVRLVGRPGGAPKLQSLPPRATFAWEAPSRAFQGVAPADDSASVTLVAGLREDAAAVVRANGWQEAHVDSADFLLAMVQLTHSGERVILVADPRNDRTSPEPRCDESTATKKNPCRPRPNPANYPPRREIWPYTEVKYGYAIRRRTDGATRWWVMEQMPEAEARRFVARVTVELLLAVEQPEKP